MKNLLAVLFAFSASWALQAPYLIGATAVTDTSVQLSWRNNDAASTGFIVLRKDTTATAYKMIDSVKSATQLTYPDLKGLKPSKLYTYQVKAYSSSAVSDTSNRVQVTTPGVPVVPDTFVAPGISVLWNYDTSKSVLIKIADRSNCETGYRVYRSTGSSTVFNLIAEIVSIQPKNKDTIIVKDTTAATNTWYSYQAAAYRGSNSVSSVGPCSTYTFRSRKPQQIAKFTKLSNFPIADSAGWAAKAGDSIILKEKNAPAGKFTAINVKNPATPTFAGYMDSTVLLSYPVQTLIPVYLKYGVKNGYASSGRQVLLCNDKIVMLKGSTLSLFKINSNSLTPLDNFSRDVLSTLLKLNDSAFTVQFTAYQVLSYNYFLPMKISATKFIKSDSISAGLAGGAPASGASYSSSFGNRGQVDNTLFIPINQQFYSHYVLSTNSYYLAAYDLGLNRQVTVPGSIARTFSNNSGYSLTPTQFLSEDTSHVYAEEINDLDAYQTASSNNAVLPDSFHSRQNVLVDTVKKLVYILYNTNMSIFSYTFVTVGVKNDFSQHQMQRGEIRILPGSGQSGVIILFPGTARHADLSFYDLSGRLVDRVTAIGSNAILWRPKARGKGFFIVSAKIDGEAYSAKFLTR